MQTDILLHNIGHHDFYLELENPEQAPFWILPEGYKMKSIGQRILEELRKQKPEFQLSSENPDIIEFSKPLLPFTKGKNRWKANSVITKDKKLSDDWKIARQATVTRIRLPILLPILREFEKKEAATKRYLILLTQGQSGSSTECIGNILLQMVQHFFPQITSTHVHYASGEAYAFDGRSEFFHSQIYSQISKYRKEVVEFYAKINKPKNWKKHFHFYLSLNSGTTSVILAALNAIASYRLHPKLFMMKEARCWPTEKSFDVKIFTEKEFQQKPKFSLHPIDSTKKTLLNPIQIQTVKAMQAWKDEFITAKNKREHTAENEEERSFFFRKGGQEVLAVIAMKDPEKPDRIKTISGVNLEVSLPTGSLCAERNAIGSCLVENPKLRLQDIQCVAVFCLKDNPTLGPCGVCQEWLRKVAEVNPDFSVLTFEDKECNTVFIDYLN